MAGWFDLSRGDKKVYGGGRRDRRGVSARLPLQVGENEYAGEDLWWSATNQEHACWGTPKKELPIAGHGEPSLTTKKPEQRLSAKRVTEDAASSEIISSLQDIECLRKALLKLSCPDFCRQLIRIPSRYHPRRLSRVILWCEDLGMCVFSVKTCHSYIGLPCAVSKNIKSLEVDVHCIPKTTSDISIENGCWKYPAYLLEKMKQISPSNVGVKRNSICVSAAVGLIGLEPLCIETKSQYESERVSRSSIVKGSRVHFSMSHVHKKWKTRAPSISWGDAMRRHVLGAWLTGERHLGCLVAECEERASCGSSIVDVATSQEGGLIAANISVFRVGFTRTIYVSIHSLASIEALVAASCAAWPEGIVIRGLYDDFYVPATLVEARLPELSKLVPPRVRGDPTLPISIWTKVLDFSGNCSSASFVCFGLARAVDLLCAREMGSLVASSRIADPCMAAANDLSPGKFVAEGACKRVYVTNGQAVGVTDLSLLGETTSVLREIGRELEISGRLTALVSRGVCLNFVSTTDAFLCHYPPGSTRSDALSCFYSYEQAQRRGLWLYAHMGLCEYGDIEGLLRKQTHGVLPESTTFQFFFQMCFAVYVSRAALGLRHYDVKLLNFLVAPIKNHAITARYHLGITTFDVLLRRDDVGGWVKLADFGTSHFDYESLGRPTNGALLTTLENTPLDILFGGDSQDTHAFAHDTFSLGLAALHLFGGVSPYEELMQSCTCPANLCQALALIWDKLGTMLLFASADCDAKDQTCYSKNNTDAPLDTTLLDTFYRMLVLLGIPLHDDDTISKLSPGATSVLDAARACLLRSTQYYPQKSRTCNKAQRNDALNLRQTQQRFAKHSYMFNLQTGVHPAIRRCRRRLGSNLYILKAMLDLDPRKRPTMRAILSSPLFTALRLSFIKNKFAHCSASTLVFDVVRRADENGSIPDV